jgi:phosphatidylserine/phosphatidylglycerophosphate/cardiolipin synthase-like enzyme
MFSRAGSLALIVLLTALLHAETIPSEDIQLLFDPLLEKVVLQAISDSRESIELEMFRLTDRRVVKALQKAANRGVLVRVILCPSQPDNTYAAKKLLASGAQQLWYPLTEPNQIMHLKMAVFDGKLLLFGSPNWTFTGLNISHEAVMLISRTEIVNQARDRFEQDWRVSTQSHP